MTKFTTSLFQDRAQENCKDPLSEVLRKGARKLLAQALEAEVETYLEAFSGCREEDGPRQVVRNGYLPEREIQTGIGPVAVRQPRVRDRRPEAAARFTSKILPPYLRKTKSLEELIPWLYLKGVSTGDYAEALQALLGPEAPGLSASTIVRLKKSWEQDFQEWNRRSLRNKRYVYFWVDGIYFNIRLEENRSCILVVMGATQDGRKELVAVQDGFRESEESWKELLLDLKTRGLTIEPEVAVGDGALGFWKALRKIFPKTREQRCWVHKTANVLNCFPKSLQSRAKQKLHDIWMAETKVEAEKAFDLFVETYQAKYPKATEKLRKNRDALLTFYSFPAEHWKHLRTTNPIESTFATVRLRTRKTKGSGSRAACLSMVFQLTQSAEKKWRKLDGHQLLADVIQGVRFKDGTKIAA